MRRSREAMVPQGPVAGGFVESWVWLGTDRRILVSRRARENIGGGGGRHSKLQALCYATLSPDIPRTYQRV